ncbi:MAG TPA: hypothetical protein VGL77_10760, partial [Armatimonadota bacterium]
DMTVIREQERNYPAVAQIFPEGGQAFLVRDTVSFTALPKVTPGLRVDGDLSDWPTAKLFTLGKPEQYVALTPGARPGDIAAEMRVAWDRGNLYFAVKVRGKDAANSGGIKLLLTNAQDQRMAYYEENNSYREYDFLRKPDGSVTLRAHSRTPEGYGVLYASKTVPGGVDYEIALPVWETGNTVQIDPNRWVKLSAAVLDSGEQGYWQWYGGVKEPTNFNTYGDFQLAAYGQDEWGQKYGCFMAGNGRERSGYVGMALLQDGGRVLVSSTQGADMGEAIVQDARGQVLRRFPIKTGQRVHSVEVDRDGRLMIGDRLLGVRFFSLQDGSVIPVGPLRSFYPVRHIVEYRTQGVTQDAAGNYFVTVLRKRRLSGEEETNEQLLAGMTMYSPTGEEVKAFGADLPYINYGVVHAFGVMGEMAGAFLYPESLAVDSANRLWVADIDARTLQVFTRTTPQTYARLPLLYTPMPEGMYPCHLRALPDGSMLLWNADRMAVAKLVAGKLTLSASVPLDGQAEDVKVEGDMAVAMNRDGALTKYRLPR